MYMDEFREYSSFEAYQAAKMAKTKGLTLLESDYYEGDLESYTGKGYCVVKEIAEQTLTLKDDGTVFQDYDYDYYDGDGCVVVYKAVHWNLTLEQAKERIANFNGTIKNHPRFFAYVRTYGDEPGYFETMQQVYLDEFAHRHGITYAGKFVCLGGPKDEPCGAREEAAVDDIIKCCEASFSDITKDDYLVVADYDRLNNATRLWESKYAIISVSNEDAVYKSYYEQYKRYHYYNEVTHLFLESVLREDTWEELCQKVQEVMSEQDEPAIEWDEEDEEPCIVPEEQDE